ncbi:hypothetical protein [Rathayibacter agropyri]
MNRLTMWEERLSTLVEDEATREQKAGPVTRSKKPSCTRMNKLVNLAFTAVEREELDNVLIARGIKQVPGEPLTSEALSYLRECFNSPHNVDTSVRVEELATPRNTKAKGYTGRPPSKQGMVRDERIPIKLTEESHARLSRAANFFDLSLTTLLRYRIFGKDERASESHVAQKRRDAKELKFSTMERGQDDLSTVYTEAAIYGELDTATASDSDTHLVEAVDDRATTDTIKGTADTLQPQGA